MTQTIDAVFENGVFRPQSPTVFSENERVRLTVASAEPAADSGQAVAGKNDPLSNVRVATGIADLAENFDEYRLGNRAQ